MNTKLSRRVKSLEAQTGVSDSRLYIAGSKAVLPPEYRPGVDGLILDKASDPSSFFSLSRHQLRELMKRIDGRTRSIERNAT